MSESERSETDLTCSSCGDTFSLSARMRERFPGWEPDLCRTCHTSRSEDNRSSTSSGGTSTRSRGGRSRGKSLAEENLTTAEVLDKYADGPSSGVFTDGSAIPNPGPGGWGAVYVDDGEVVAQAHGHDPETTNNRMELTAVIQGARLVPDGTAATVHTDSRLVVDTITKWAAGWQRRGWKRKTGEVMNLDLVKEAYAIYSARPELELVWIAAHSGQRWNEYADSLSTAWMREEV